MFKWHLELKRRGTEEVYEISCRVIKITHTTVAIIGVMPANLYQQTYYLKLVGKNFTSMQTIEYHDGQMDVSIVAGQPFSLFMKVPEGMNVFNE